ncbi:hypothetical protein HDK64DRAFT_264102 [Phyllosticta capitalensis]
MKPSHHAQKHRSPAAYCSSLTLQTGHVARVNAVHPSFTHLQKPTTATRCGLPLTSCQHDLQKHPSYQHISHRTSNKNNLKRPSRTSRYVRLPSNHSPDAPLTPLPQAPPQPPTMAPRTRHTTNLPPLPVTLVWLSHYKGRQGLLHLSLTTHGATPTTSLTADSTLSFRDDPRLMTRGAFRNAVRRQLDLAALPVGAQIWEAFFILPAEPERADGVPDAVNLETERWDDVQGRLRRLPVGRGVEVWFTLRELEEGEELFEEE